MHSAIIWDSEGGFIPFNNKVAQRFARAALALYLSGWRHNGGK
jgi:hypothetical protein